jgi:sugar-specific transcriptional regulator TrmB
MISTLEFQNLLIRCGLEQKDARVYLALLTSGPSPVRKIAGIADINRGTTHTILHSLIDRGLVSYYHKQKRQYFVAENPEKIATLFQDTLSGMKKTYQELQTQLPKLQALRGDVATKTAVRSYEGRQGIRLILEDVLDIVGAQEKKLYRVYSSVEIRDSLYQSFPSFTDERIHRGISVKVIAVGAGGEYQELSERRWLPTNQGTPTYRILYADTVVTISQNTQDDELRAFVIQDDAIYRTEAIIFDHLWDSLGK